MLKLKRKRKLEDPPTTGRIFPFHGQDQFVGREGKLAIPALDGGRIILSLEFDLQGVSFAEILNPKYVLPEGTGGIGTLPEAVDEVLRKLGFYTFFPNIIEERGQVTNEIFAAAHSVLEKRFVYELKNLRPDLRDKDIIINRMVVDLEKEDTQELIA